MGLVVIAILMGISLVLALKDTRKALFVSVFFLPWGALMVDVGLNVSAFLGLWTSLVLVVLLNQPVAIFKMHGIAYAFILWGVVWSLVQLPFLSAADVQGGSLRGPILRGAFQVIMFLLLVSPVWVVPAVVRSTTDIVKLGQIYILSATLLCLLGVLQVAIWKLTGADPLPIGIINTMLGGRSPVEKSAEISYMGADLFRMTSLGGEPRQLGENILIGLALLQAYYIYVGLTSRLKWVWFLMLLCVYMTYSSSSYFIYCFILLSAIVAAYAFPHVWTSGTRKRIKGLRLLTAATILLLVLAATIGSQMDPIEYSPLRMLYDRTFGRFYSATEVENKYFQEDFDEPIIDFLLDEPENLITGVGLGNAHLYANDYLPEVTAEYARNTSFVSKRGYLRLLSELGFIGLGLLLLWVYSTLQAVRRLSISMAPQPLFLVALVFSCCVFVAYMANSALSTHFYLALGILEALRDCDRTVMLD